MKEYFNTGKIKYEGAKSKNPFSFRHYNPDEIIDILEDGRQEHLESVINDIIIGGTI